MPPEQRILNVRARLALALPACHSPGLLLPLALPAYHSPGLLLALALPACPRPA